MGTVTSHDGTTIAFERTGTGPALILVDGAMCSRSFGPMGPLAALLAPHFTVFTYDRRGRGESGDTAPYAVEREVEDLAALIEAAGGSAFVYGISSGAALALTAASQLSSITRLALYEPPFSVDADAAQRWKAYRTKLTELLGKGRRGDAVELFMTFVGAPAEAVAPMRQSPVWPAFEAVAPTLAYDAAALGDGLVPTARAAKIAVPTLAMTGGASPEWMRQVTRASAEAIPGARYHTLAGQTHEVAAEAIAPALTEFFQATEAHQ
jgi:pimeloyl-ACP methyl ester carboxylesterase